jgi:nitronate monooxygenase
MMRFVDQAIEAGVRFFVTSLGNPRWVVEKAHAAGGFVYHDVTERKWAMKGLEAGVDGLIAVNNWAGGHAGPKSAEALIAELGDLGVPVVCAGGVGDEEAFVRALRMGYAGVQMGTRFIATAECTAHADYKRAIVQAEADDIVLTERITGVPVAVIRTPYIEKAGVVLLPGLPPGRQERRRNRDGGAGGGDRAAVPGGGGAGQFDHWGTTSGDPAPF